MLKIYVCDIPAVCHDLKCLPKKEHISSVTSALTIYVHFRLLGQKLQSSITESPGEDGVKRHSGHDTSNEAVIEEFCVDK